MRTRIAVLVLALAAVPSSANAPKPVLRYQPQPDDERPMPIAVFVGPQGGSLAMSVTFDRVPWGEECKNRCANSTFFFDLDNNRKTGLQMGPKAAETGADLAVTLQGTRDFKDVSADYKLRAKARQFLSSAVRVDDGGVFSELDLRRDVDRLRNNGNVVLALIDVVQVDVPSGKKMRVVFHPAGGTAIEAEAPGMMTPDGKPKLFPR